MALFGMEIKRRHKKAVGGFHAEYIDQRVSSKKKKMGFFRSLGSAGSLILGGSMFYIALHYIPAYLGLQKIIALSELDNSATRLAKDDQFSLLSAYIDPFRLNRTYLRAGQSIQVQYALPANTEMEVYINRCRPAFIVEIFKCDVISQKTATVKNDKVGTQRFKFKDSGFYTFNESVVQKSNMREKYRVVWSRV